MGLDVTTERSQDRWLCSVVVHACREEGTSRQKPRRKKEHEQNPTAPKEGVQHKASGRRGKETEQKRRTGDCGWRKKKNQSNQEQYQQRRVTTWEKGKGAGARKRDPPQVLTGKHHASERGREGGDQC